MSMTWWRDLEFIGLLLETPSFYRTGLVWLGLFIAGLVAIGALIRRYGGIAHRPGQLHRDTRGAAAVVDFILTFPVFMVVVLLVLQFAVLANGAVIVHYAAYSAARSARVWMWDKDFERPWPRPPLSQYRYLEFLRNTGSEVQSRVETAARFALIAASPADSRVRNSPKSVPRTLLRAMAAAGGSPGRAGVLLTKAGYAFDDRNSDVEYSVAPSGPLSSPGNGWPVEVKLRYNMHLDIPVAAWMIGNNRGDGSYYLPINAEVTLL